MKNREKFITWVNSVALALLLIGGFNYFLMAFLNWDVFAAIFGGSGAVVSRIIYALFGISAIVLVSTLLWRAFMNTKKVSKPRTTQ